MKILSCIFVIIGIIIGAGFASGKEIYTFFFVYGKNGIIGIIISSFLIGYTIYKSLKIIREYEINNYDELLKKVIIKKYKNISIEKVLITIINIFLLITFFVMCAGFTAYFKQEFGINEIYTSILIACLNYFVLSKNTKGIIGLNTILIPVIIILLSIFMVKDISSGVETIEQLITSNAWLPKAVLYASYNSITLISMLIPMKKYIRDKKDIIKVAISTTIIIILLASIIFIMINNINTDISKIELPAVFASRNFWISI
ncbi:MAG: hypothetical protein HFJ54_02735 [Clostridia bacterium]|nr:hypothetical protein [Clostridia bacterium]